MPSLIPDGSFADRSWGYARAEHLLELQDFVKKQPLAPIQRIIEWAGSVQQKEARMIRLLEEKERKKRRRTEKEEGEKPHDPTDKPSDEPVKVPEPEPEVSVLVVPRRTVEGASTDDLLRSSPVAESKVIRSTSSKLNHILTEVYWSRSFVRI